MKSNKFNIEDLLRDFPDESVSHQFKEKVMKQISAIPETAMTKNRLLPERYFLLFSLFAGFLVLIFLVDFDFMSQYLLQVTRLFGSWLQSEQYALPAFFKLIGDLPALSLAVIPALLMLFAFERLLHNRFFSKNVSLI